MTQAMTADGFLDRRDSMRGAFVAAVTLHAALIGALVLLYWACQPGTPGPNRYGPNPL